MHATKPLTLTLLLAVIAIAVCAGPASSKAIYEYDVQMLDASVNGSASNEVNVRQIDPAQSSTLRITHLGVETVRGSLAAGADNLSVSPSSLVPGDVVEVYQPSIPAGPPGVSPDETFTIPTVSVTGDPNVALATGSAPDSALSVVVDYAVGCYAAAFDDFTAVPSGNSFSVPIPTPMRPGSRARVRAFLGAGDQVEYSTRTAGESPCLNVNGFHEPDAPGETPTLNPFTVYLQNLRPGIANTRFVLSRGGTPYLDQTKPSNTESSFSFDKQPLSGDTIDVYRPSGAATPTYSYTLPRVVATFDPDSDLVAVDGDGFAWLYASAQNAFSGGNVYRTFGAVPAGRTVFDFSQPGDYDNGVGIDESGWAWVLATDLSDRVVFSLPAARGDLTAPGVSVAVAKAFSAKKLTKKIKLSVHASESSTSKITLALPKTLPTKRHPKAKKSTTTQSIAKRTVRLKPGKNSVTLKFTRKGRRALAQLRAVGSKLRPVALTVTVTSKDAAGNAVTVVQQGKVAR